MESLHFLQALQLNDSFFPTGAFSFSDGLESAVEQKRIQDGTELSYWMDIYLHHSFYLCEGLSFHRTCLAYFEKDWEQIYLLDQELTAIKPSATVRMSSHTVGKRFLKTCLPLHPHEDLEKLMKAIDLQTMDGNASVVYALVMSSLKFPEKEAMLSYGYSCLMAIVSAALRLISIGQQEGQTLLAHYLKKLPEVVEKILKTDPQKPLVVFNPFLDIQQMRHQYLYTRLFRS